MSSGVPSNTLSLDNLNHKIRGNEIVPEEVNSYESSELSPFQQFLGRELRLPSDQTEKIMDDFVCEQVKKNTGLIFDKREQDFAMSLLGLKKKRRDYQQEKDNSERSQLHTNNFKNNNPDIRRHIFPEQIVCDVESSPEIHQFRPQLSKIAHLNRSEVSTLIPLLKKEVSELLLMKKMEDFQQLLKMNVMHENDLLPDMSTRLNEIKDSISTNESNSLAALLPHGSRKTIDLHVSSDEKLIVPLESFSYSSPPHHTEECHNEKSSMKKICTVSRTISNKEQYSDSNALINENMCCGTNQSNLPDADLGVVNMTPLAMSSTTSEFGINAGKVELPPKPSMFTQKKKHNDVVEKKVQRKLPKKEKIPEGRSKQPLSAYNFFFRDERFCILGESGHMSNLQNNANNTVQKGEIEDSAVKVKRKVGRPRGPKYHQRRPKHGQISYQNSAKTVSAKWKSLSPEIAARYYELAAQERGRYDKEVLEFHSNREKKRKSCHT